VTPVKNDVIYFLIDVPYGIPSGRGSPEGSWGIEMKIKYFSDTDTALVEFSDRAVAETREINENIYIDLDRSGNLVAMTIEHARQQASLPFLSYEQIEEKSPNRVRGSFSLPLPTPPGMRVRTRRFMKPIGP
jgi:uncharacterized protein YuzE